MPAQADSFRPEARTLALLRRLEWRVRHAVANVLSGQYRSAFRGRGMEFDQVVKYEFGDDVRDLDWNVTARLGEPYRKKFVEEREVTLLVLLEDTPGLQYGSGDRSKREALLELAGLVMLLGAINRDRVGYLHLQGSAYTFHPPVRGRGPIHHLAASLLGHPPPPLHSPGPAEPPLLGTKGPTPGANPWHLLSRAAPRHSILLWLSDFLPGPEPEGWSVLRQRYQTLGFRVDDPWERDFPQTPENGAVYDPLCGRLVTLEGSRAERAAHAAWKASREAHFAKLFPDLSSRLAVRTDEDRLESLVRFFHARRQRGKGV